MQSSTPAADPTYVYPGMQSHCRPARMSKAGAGRSVQPPSTPV